MGKNGQNATSYVAYQQKKNTKQKQTVKLFNFVKQSLSIYGRTSMYVCMDSSLGNIKWNYSPKYIISFILYNFLHHTLTHTYTHAFTKFPLFLPFIFIKLNIIFFLFFQFLCPFFVLSTMLFCLSLAPSSSTVHIYIIVR